MYESIFACYIYCSPNCFTAILRELDGVWGIFNSSAGTRSVIVSLWSVPDAATANLMKEFYINFEQKKLNKAQALRQAMLKMKNQYPNEPKKWAAFTLIGEAE